MANALTTLRLLAALPFYALMRSGPEAAGVAALLLALAIGTDLLDGPIARRRGTESPATELFDHCADVLFVVGGLAGAAERGAVPVLLPGLVGIAFAQYVADSAWTLREGEPFRLQPSALGRWNGILYFVPLVGDVGGRLGSLPLGAAVRGVAWALVFTTGASILDRARRRRRPPRGAPDSPEAGTRGQSTR